MLPKPPHWATSRAAGSHDCGEIREQRIVIGHPVECRGREDRVHLAVDGERRAEVRDDVLDPVAEAGEAPACRLDHRRGAIQRDDPTTRQSIGQLLGDAARPATGVEYALVAPQREPVQDGRAPAGHRIGHPVVGPGVPVAQHGPLAAGRHAATAGLSAASVARPVFSSRSP